MTATVRTVFLLAAILCGAGAAQAQQSELFGRYELHYSVVNSTFLNPQVAATYGLVRGDKRAILTLAVRDKEAPPGETYTMQLQGNTWDLIQNQTLEFLEVREGNAVYYLAEFKFINEEWRFFEVNFRPEGAQETFAFKFKHQLYVDP